LGQNATEQCELADKLTDTRFFMATDTTTPAKPPALTGDPDRPSGKLLPALLLAALLVALGAGIYYLVGYLRAVETAASANAENKLVLRRMTEAVRLFDPVTVFGTPVNGKLFWLTILFAVTIASAAWLAHRYLVKRRPFALGSTLFVAALNLPTLVGVILALRARGPTLDVDAAFFWTPVLVGVLSLAVVYVVWMYIADARAVGWVWATFLGTLRVAVYVLLAGVFLLPAVQSSEKTESFSRVLLLLDLSGSMGLVDEVIEEDRPTPPTRLDQVHALLTNVHAPQGGVTLGGRAFAAGEIIPPAELAKATPEQQAALVPFVARLVDKNPVIVYGFGGKLDDDFKEFKKDGPTFSAADWTAWLTMDLKRWLLDELAGLSPPALELARKTIDPEPDKPGTPQWANEWLANGPLPNFDNLAAKVEEPVLKKDKELFAAKREKLQKKLDVRQQVLAGTNYGDSVLTALTRESASMIAGIVVVGDGASNQGSPSTYGDLRQRAQNLKVPIFTVGIGELRELLAIRITDLQAPQQAPPDDAFQVRVEVDGEGLVDKEAPVTLDIYRPGEPKTPALQLNAVGVFKAGGVPHATVEFKIDPAAPEFAGLTTTPSGGKPELVEGRWKFIARIPRAKGESFAGKEHVSDAAEVEVIKKPLRVLLFAGGPTREYQFTRRMFVNEMDKKRAELSVYLQVTDPKGARVQDVPQERLLKAFPNVLRVDDDPNEKAEDKFYNLAQYDLIIAFDLDWTQVPREQLDLLQKWVEVQAGGLVVVGGPIHTFQLARGSNFEKIKPVVELLPVRVKDARLAGLSVDRPTSRPWRLNFPGITTDTEYLRLDDDQKKPEGKTEPLAGWEEFFTGRATGSGAPPVGETPLRGFYGYYPIESLKPTATVIATFTDPQARMVKEDTTTEEQPFLVSMPFGKGKVIYLSSGEMWRLRLYKEVYHERLWNKLGRFAAAGTQTKQARRGGIDVSRQYAVGNYLKPVVRLFGADLEPLPITASPELRVIPPAGQPQTIKLLPIRSDNDWKGRFEAQFQVTAPGEYQLEVPVPGSSEVLKEKFIAREVNVEMDRSRPNFGLLRSQLAGTVADLRVGDTVKAAARAKLGSALPKVEDKAAAGTTEETRDEPALYFDAKSAVLIPEFLTAERKVQKNRGPVVDLWPAGPDLNLFGMRGTVGTVLLIVVGLLSIEWLTRKLLRLA